MHLLSLTCQAPRNWLVLLHLPSLCNTRERHQAKHTHIELKDVEERANREREREIVEHHNISGGDIHSHLCGWETPLKTTKPTWDFVPAKIFQFRKRQINTNHNHSKFDFDQLIVYKTSILISSGKPTSKNRKPINNLKEADKES